MQGHCTSRMITVIILACTRATLSLDVILLRSQYPNLKVIAQVKPEELSEAIQSAIAQSHPVYLELDNKRNLVGL